MKYCQKCGCSVEGMLYCPGCGANATQQKSKIPLWLKIAFTIISDIPLIFILFPCVAFIVEGDVTLFSIIGTIWPLGMLYLANIYIYQNKFKMDNTTKLIITIISVALGISLLFLGLLPVS